MRSISDDQAHVYLTRAEGYDELVSAEDANGELGRALRELLPAATIADVGAGTGRVSRVLAGHAQHTHLVERAAPMLDVARERLTALGVPFEAHLADARALPLADASVDGAVAGWVFGHFRHWMPEGWQAEVDAALAEMNRVVRRGGQVLVVETLGTGYETPRRHALLDEYFAHLEALGFARRWVRTDYAFESVDEAAHVLGSFFGDAMAATVRERGWRRVPECTGIWSRTRS